eukprot:TRINITY_DN37498_c0_g1_i1.p1 TRINITY_DN37498_c0_g1~~TRINITY_DN37498_c0_g1_i1.p1  ORF type:complete len:589 (-),score=131.25 TRINITY_DN37498_c0_g1_i1:429-2195(-)
MEKENFSVNDNSPRLSYAASSTPNWQSSSAMDVQLGELNCASGQLPSCFLNLNWENSMDQNVPFESGLSSIVSSPAASNAAVPTESVVIRELIGRLGSICNSGEISPRSQTLGGSGSSYIGGNNNSTNTSCYSTPLNSPPKLNLSIMDHQVRGNLPISGSSMPSHPSLAPFSADPGFAERAAKFSCFSNRNFGGLLGQFGLPEVDLPNRYARRAETGKLSRVSSSQSLKAGSQMSVFDNKDVALPDGFEAEMQSSSALERKFNRLSRPSTPDNVELCNAHEESSISGQNIGGESASKGLNETNGRKRKAAPKNKPKDLPSSPPSAKDAKAVEDVDSNAKRCKPAEASGTEKDGVKPSGEENSNANAGAGTQRQSKENSKPPEPPKQDYIHVRARRGQATDSHSLAERVRREKISERMKFLQDLVPGCNKVTGKAVMLDEIINYVQSLQRQVEFLSMKLATVNPRLDFNMETLLSKDIIQARGSLPPTMYPVDSSASTFSYVQQPQLGPLTGMASNGFDTQSSVNPLDATLRRALSMQLPAMDGYADASSQLTNFWEDDLQSVVQMGFGQNQETAFHGTLPTGHMKIEL